MARPAEEGRRWHCGTAWGLPCSDGSRCCVVDTEQDPAGCIPERRICRTARTGLAVVVAAAAVACTFVVVFSAVVAGPTIADVSTVPAVEPTVAVVSFVVVVLTVAVDVVAEPSVAVVDAVAGPVVVVAAAVDTSVAGTSAGCVEAGAGGWSMAEVAGCSCWVWTCSVVCVPSCCSWRLTRPHLARSWRTGREVAGRRSGLKELPEVFALQSAPEP